MGQHMPRIASVAVHGPSTLTIRWQGGGSDDVDLSGWIATGGDILAPLKDRNRFEKAAVGDYGASIEWDDGDLAIDAVHLEALAVEQRPFAAPDMVSWQARVSLSNREAAAFLGVALSTFHTYKTGSVIPAAIAMACRAALRDPILLQAHYRPLTPGRPKRPAA